VDWEGWGSGGRLSSFVVPGTLITCSSDGWRSRGTPAVNQSVTLSPTTQMKATALLFSALFLVGGIGADYCFGQLLKRGYEAAPDDWERAGRPTWWTWKPAEMMLPQWYYNAPRWRWIWSGPPWVRTDHVSRSLHAWHRLLFILMLVAWVGGLIGVAVASNSK
jgi:hypothetical protein